MSDSEGMTSKFKYVRFDPEGRYSLVHTRTKARIEWLKSFPWVGKPAIHKQFGYVCKSQTKVARFATEREAALYVDKWFIEKGRQPVNILKPRP